MADEVAEVTETTEQFPEPTAEPQIAEDVKPSQVAWESAEPEDAPDEGPIGEIKSESPDTEWDTDTLESAKRYGMTEDEAKSWGSRDALERAMVALDKQAAAWGRKQLEQSQPPAEQPRDEQGRFAPKPEQPPQQPPAQMPKGYEKYTLPIDTSEWDEETVGVLNGLNDHYDTLLRSQQEKMAQMEQILVAVGERVLEGSDRTQVDESRRFTSEMDSFFDALGDEFKDVFGKGAVTSLEPQGSHLSQRNQLIEEMKVLAYADDQAGRPRQGYKELAQRALRSLHYDKLKTTARKEVEATLKKRQSQQIARTSGNNKPKDKREAAIAKVEDFYRTKGFALSDWSDEEIEV